MGTHASPRARICGGRVGRAGGLENARAAPLHKRALPHEDLLHHHAGCVSLSEKV